jgi:hypothetical protein
MADKSQKAVAAIAALYASTPTATLDEFLAVAVRADPQLTGVAKRSFNARYLLPLKRANMPKKPRKKRVLAKSAKTTAASPKRAAGGGNGRRRRAATGPRIAADSRNEARRLILERDQKLRQALMADGDPQAAYELAAGVDAFTEQLARVLRG